MKRYRNVNMTPRRILNVNQIHKQTLNTGQRIADSITTFSSSITFLFMNIAVFILWILLGTWLHFDPYPFQALTMVVSLEAIFLSIFVLISQNRQEAKDRLMAEEDYQSDLRAERLLQEIKVSIQDQDARLCQITQVQAEQDLAIEGQAIHTEKIMSQTKEILSIIKHDRDTGQQEAIKI